MNLRRCFLVVSFSLLVYGQAPNGLLPQPQKISYGAGKLPLNGLRIVLPAHAVDEDRFAAEQLSSCIRQRSGAETAIVANAESGNAIVLRRTGAVDALPRPGEQPGPDSRESYQIRIRAHDGEIEAKSTAGLFYGVQTACQMIQPDRTLPEATSHDWPAFAFRGLMVDMSEGQLPTAEEIKRQVDFLARWKVNQYYFYNEANIELTGYGLMNPSARYTKQQIRDIVEYARQRHIDVVPCLEFYAHLHDLFRVEKYSDLADFSHGGEFRPGDPRVKKLIADWADQYAELFPSPFMHIGFDEAWHIQQAATKQGNGATAVSLFVQQLKDVDESVLRHGKTAMAWGDIMVKYPGIVKQLPPGLIAVAWYYEPQPDPEYKQWLAPLIQNKTPHFVAPGVNSWDEIYPDYDLTFANIDTFIAAGRKSGAMGVMNTIWTDDAQMLMRLSWPGMVYGAVRSWKPEPASRSNFWTDYAAQLSPPAARSQLALALEKLNASELALQKAIGHDTMNALWKDPFDPQVYARYAGHGEHLRQSRLLVEEALESLDAVAAAAPQDDDLENLILAGRMLDLAGLKFQYGIEFSERWRALGDHPTKAEMQRAVNELSAQQHGKVVDLLDAFSELKPQYEHAWRGQFEEYRLGSALARWSAESEYWRRFQVRLLAVPAHYQPGSALPSLESLVQ